MRRTAAIDKLRSAFDNLEHAKMGDNGRGGGNVNITLMECMDQMTEASAKKDRRLTELQGELSAKQHQLQLAEQRAGAALTELDEMRRQASHLKRIVDFAGTLHLDLVCSCSPLLFCVASFKDKDSR